VSATEDRRTAAGPSADGSGKSPAGTTVVVGAAQGIGAGIARRLAAEAWTTKLVLADIKLEGVRELAAELAGADAEVDAMAVDITDGPAVDELVAATADAERAVIAAGRFAPAPALEVEREEFARIFKVNTEGVFFVAQAYARVMAERGQGAIVGVASIAARMPRMRQASYCSSKAGMRQALRVLGMEVGPLGVRVNTVSPGATDTPMMRALAADHSSVDDLAHGSIEAMRPRIPDGRVARPEDVAAVVSFLLAPGSEHVMLEDIVVDGGELLGM
jgi:2,3-dihydro-2,3-dihydroxybenzoate dehydrogenase